MRRGTFRRPARGAQVDPIDELVGAFDGDPGDIDAVVYARAARRPRFGVARSTDGRSAAEVAAEPIAEPPR